MSLVFTVSCVTNQAKALTLNGTLDFQINFVKEKRTKSYVLDKAMKNDWTVNNPEGSMTMLSHLGWMKTSAHK